MQLIFFHFRLAAAHLWVGRLLVILASATITSLVWGQYPISIDGDFSDWDSVPVAYESAGGSGSANNFGTLKLANDQQFLYLSVELATDVILQDFNTLQLWIDTDADPATGIPIGEIGAELVWNFGQRSGVVQQSGDAVPVLHADIGYRHGPTVSGTRFEIAIRRNSTINGQPLFSAPLIRLVLRDGDSGAQIPSSGQTIEYTFSSVPVPLTPIDFQRSSPDDLRIMTWNVRNDGPWNPSHSSRFGRILLATQPDIINFQEIYDHTETETAAFAANWYLPPSGVWHSSGNSDCKTVSGYPVLGSWPLSGNNAMLIDTNEKFGKPLLLINVHFPCCNSNNSRQNQIDQVLAFIRNAKQPGGALTLEPDTPIIIAGDLNLVTFASQLESLLTGQIVNQSTYGPSFSPDWDGQSLRAIIPRHSDKRMGYTWRSPFSTFSPGMLDYHVYTSSVLYVEKHYLVNTETMTGQRLASNGLLWNDSWASDHLPYIADYRLEAVTPTSILGCFVLHSRWSGEGSSEPWAGIDLLKTVAKEGEGPKALTLNNLINSSGGIEGLVVDALNLRQPDLVSANDFLFQISPAGAFSEVGHPPSSWQPAPPPSSIEIISDSVDRIVIKWPENGIENRWLRVTLLANFNTGLEEPQVFYVGHLLGETTGASEGFFSVSFSDILPIRFLVGQAVDSSSTVDIDKNGVVSFADISAMRANIGNELTAITIP